MEDELKRNIGFRPTLGPVPIRFLPHGTLGGISVNGQLRPAFEGQQIIPFPGSFPQNVAAPVPQPSQNQGNIGQQEMRGGYMDSSGSFGQPGVGYGRQATVSGDPSLSTMSGLPTSGGAGPRDSWEEIVWVPLPRSLLKEALEGKLSFPQKSPYGGVLPCQSDVSPPMAAYGAENMFRADNEARFKRMGRDALEGGPENRGTATPFHSGVGGGRPMLTPGGIDMRNNIGYFDESVRGGPYPVSVKRPAPSDMSLQQNAMGSLDRPPSTGSEDEPDSKKRRSLDELKKDGSPSRDRGRPPSTIVQKRVLCFVTVNKEIQRSVACLLTEGEKAALFQRSLLPEQTMAGGVGRMRWSRVSDLCLLLSVMCYALDGVSNAKVMEALYDDNEQARRKKGGGAYVYVAPSRHASLRIDRPLQHVAKIMEVAMPSVTAESVRHRCERLVHGLDVRKVLVGRKGSCDYDISWGGVLGLLDFFGASLDRNGTLVIFARPRTVSSDLLQLTPPNSSGSPEASTVAGSSPPPSVRSVGSSSPSSGRLPPFSPSAADQTVVCIESSSSATHNIGVANTDYSSAGLDGCGRRRIKVGGLVDHFLLLVGDALMRAPATLLT